MTDEELIEQVARAIEVKMGPVFGTPEYLADPVKLARSEKRRWESALQYAQAALAAINLPAQLEAAHTQGWNEAIEAAAKACEAETDYTTVTPYVHRARLAFVIHNLTKDSTHD